MVDYYIYNVTVNSIVKAPKGIDFDRKVAFDKTFRNLYNMLNQGRKCKIVSPVRILDKHEIEQYRRYFCKKAKEDLVNYIYFTIPVEVYE